ncbi:LuxR C-terminal-related transcriptional regulator [Microbacterium invictum]|uniref:DNA-binding CsgD family transcriptional regulator n=1 Tax=Microbacterium invictum TaxID=515415 RepID=A0AA40SPR4_9MICO|nr:MULTISPECIES: LuxR C-terminal-related transcriptional regulator [Microbacterium]MBB4139992.1 DNA-binding CsgD family transcriptional regulator [Microbacterium invictum]
MTAATTTAQRAASAGRTAHTTMGIATLASIRATDTPGRRPGEALLAAIADAAATPAAADGPIRGIVVGPAGSGKTAVLRALRAELAARGLATTAAIPAASTEEIVFVDDAHALPDDDLDALSRFAADPEAGLVVALRPHGGDGLRQLTARLEGSRPPILLGEVTAEQVAAATRIPLHCAQALVRLTGSLTWLTLAAVDAHDADACDADPTHRDLMRALRGVIAHRLDHLDAATRSAVEALCLVDPAELSRMEPPTGTWDIAIVAGSAAGLLTPNGTPPRVVRAAVHAVIPAHRVAALMATTESHTTTSPEDDVPDDAPWAGGPDGAASRAERLVVLADALRADDPARALAMYREAWATGAEPRGLGLRFGIAALGTGDLDGATSSFDRMLASSDPQTAADATAAAIAVWAARGALAAGTTGAVGAAPATTSAVDTAAAPPSPVMFARMALAAVGAGANPGAAPTPQAGAHDTLTIASEALGAALTASLGDDVRGAVDSLVLASELYNATHSDFPLVEPPAVVAAAAALTTGALPVAASTLSAAVHAQQGGPWARPRLRLWQAWVAIQAARPDEARAHIEQAQDCGVALLPRDRLILSACEVALARRYAHTAEVMTVFREAGHHLLRRRFDTYLHPFLGELMLAAVRVGAADTVDRHFAAALTSLEQLGSPPLWAPLLHWSGIQRGILLGRPDELVPHARALLAAAVHSPFAAQLAAAGRTWTDVLAGHVDAAAVESAAQALAHHGLAWDGARLAAHGAARTADKHVYAQLLACARDLHPKQVLGAEPAHTAPAVATPDGSALSARELEVAQLVVQGKTYVEIGQTLFISPRTAEHHIARIRRRLDATSRSDLLTKLRDLLGAETDTDADAEVVA